MAAPLMARGTKQQFTATAHFSDSSTQDVTAIAKWTTSDGVGGGPSRAVVSAPTSIASSTSSSSTVISPPRVKCWNVRTRLLSKTSKRVLLPQASQR